MKKFIVFCLITLFPYVAVCDEHYGGVWWFKSEDECTANCVGTCDFYALDVGYACPIGWYYHFNSTSVSVECLPESEEFYTELQDDINDETGYYKQITTIRYNKSTCKPATMVRGDHNIDKFYCGGLKWRDRWPDYTGAANSDCNSYTTTTEVVECKGGYYYNSGKEQCVFCGTKTIGGDTYQLTSDEGNKSSQDYACYVTGANIDERGTYTLKSTSGDKCTYQMLTDQ